MIEAVIDGHNDSLRCLMGDCDRGIAAFIQGRTDGHVDLPRAKAGGLRAGFFALQIPPDPLAPRDGEIVFTSDGYVVPLAHPIAQSHAWHWTKDSLHAVLHLVERAQGKLRIVQQVRDLESCIKDENLGIIVHLEGADALDPELNNLEILFKSGLRSLGLVWSRPNIFGVGVPFRFPHSPDTGPGLTEAGFNLVRACNRLGIMLDVSHLNERGFWDVAAISHSPLVATHSAVHSLCPSSRNLTDQQLDAIRDSTGLVGVNFEVSALRVDGNDDPDTSIEILLSHIDYLVERIGIECVGFGSDFDGATMSKPLPDVAALPMLVESLKKRYGERELQLICRGNWLRVLRASWHEEINKVA